MHRFLKRRGLPTQYSVFVLEADPAGVVEILAGIGRLVDRRRDDLRLYPVPRAGGVTSLGQPGLPRAVFAGHPAAAPGRAAGGRDAGSR